MVVPDWSTLVTGLVGGGLAVAIYQSLISAKFRRSHSQWAARAKLQTIKVYVAGAIASVSHEKLQIQWSHQCAALFGEAATNAAEMGKGGPNLDEISTLLAGWLSQAPFIGQGEEKDREKKADSLCALLAKLERCIENIIEAIPRM